MILKHHSIHNGKKNNNMKKKKQKPLEMVKERKTTFFMAHWSRVVYVYERLIALEKSKKTEKTKEMNGEKRRNHCYTWEKEKENPRNSRNMDYEMHMCFTNAYSVEKTNETIFLTYMSKVDVSVVWFDLRGTEFSTFFIVKF